MEWDDKKENVTYAGFREDGYDPDALLNFLVLLGWNPGNDEELMSMEEGWTMGMISFLECG